MEVVVIFVEEFSVELALFHQRLLKKSELYLMVVVNTCQQGVSYCTDCTLIAL